MDEAELAQRQAAYFKQAYQLIDEHGWMVQGVFPTENTPLDERYPFAYTVGLAYKGLPELIVFGLGFEAAKVILNNLAQRQVDHAADHVRGYQAGDVIDDLAQGGYLCVLVDVADTTEHLTVANRLYADDGPIQALQLVFQDAAHRWPSHVDYHDRHLPFLGPLPEGI